MAELEGKVAVITGGASGIGAATVRLFVNEGARVVVADMQRERGEALAEELGTAAIFVSCEVRQEDQVKMAVDTAVGRWGRLDCIFNNAGFGGALGPIEDIPTEEFDLTFDVLVRGVFLGMKHAVPALRERGGGSIINTGSIAGVIAGRGPIVYSAAKAAVIHLTKAAAMQLGPDSIRANCICPGAIATPLAANTVGRPIRSSRIVSPILPPSSRYPGPVCRTTSRKWRSSWRVTARVLSPVKPLSSTAAAPPASCGPIRSRPTRRIGRSKSITPIDHESRAIGNASVIARGKRASLVICACRTRPRLPSGRVEGVAHCGCPPADCRPPRSDRRACRPRSCRDRRPRRRSPRRCRVAATSACHGVAPSRTQSPSSSSAASLSGRMSEPSAILTPASSAFANQPRCTSEAASARQHKRMRHVALLDPALLPVVGRLVGGEVADRERRHVPGVVLQEQLDALVVEDVAMLDAVCPQPDRVLHRLGIGRMRHHLELAQLADLEGRFQFVLQQERVPVAGPRRAPGCRPTGSA